MYFNDVHILIYVAIAIAGFFIGKFVNWCNYRLPEYKKVFSKDIFRTKELEGYKPNLLLSLITMFIYIVLLYVLGIERTFLGNLQLIKYLILTPMLLSAFIIDYRLQIIPNRLNMTMFEIGIILMFLAGIFNANIAIDMFFGMLAGAGIFLLITLIGGLIAGKEAMGFGDVKLMGALGIFFGLSNIIAITLMSFLIGAVLSIVLLATKIKKTDEYIPFGPFIVIATFIAMVVPFKTILSVLLLIFSLGTIKI
jgi:leader peptidase (prepilin peptidase)/N-methyltransferase